MGMIGSVGKAALNFAGRNLLGVDFEKQKQLQEERARRDAWMEAILRGQAQGPPTPAAPVTNSGGEDISGAFGPQASAPGKPKSYQDMLPLLMFGAMQGYKGAGEVGQLIQGAQPKPMVPLNTARGPREYDPNSGGYRHLEDFPEKPEPVTVDRVIGGILAKKAGGQPLSAQEQQIYNRWTNGTPAKGGGGGASSSGLPTGFVLD